MLPGDLLFIHGTDLLATLIEWAESNPFSHVIVVKNDHEGYQAYPGRKIEIVNIDKYLLDPANEIYTCPILTDEQRSQIIATAESFVGGNYGYKDIVADGLRYILHLKIHDISDTSTLDCSMFAYECYLKAGVRLTWAPVPSVADLSYSPLLIGKRPWEVG